jgi:septal ring factor EnvC (AmiA/AmiB activator)
MRIIIFCLLAFLVTDSVFGQSRDELERKRKEIQQEITELQRSQSILQKDKKANLAALAAIQSKIRKRNAIISNISQEVRLIDETIFNNNREIFRLRRQLDTLREQYAKTLVYAYQNRSSYDMINFVFSSVNFNDAIRRVQYLKTYRNYREEQVASIYKTQDLLKDKISTLHLNKKEKSRVLEEQTQEMKTLEDDKREQNAYVQRLKAREKELASELAAKRRVANSLQSAIAAIILKETRAAAAKAAADAKAAAAAKATAARTAPATTPASSAAAPAATERKYNVLENTPEVTRVSVGFENNRRNLPWPVDRAQISSPFGRRKIEGTSLYEDNQWITIATEVGTAVKAVFEGVVTTVYDVQGSQTVTIKHGKYFTTYYNLSSVAVNKGDQVRMGQVIGKAGSNDDGDGEILFVVNQESRFLDPEQWLKAR